MRISAFISAVVIAASQITNASAQGAPAVQGGDPPSRVGRLSDMSGAVSLYPSGATDWTDASINYPLTSGDAVWADDTSRAEIQLGTSAIRIGANSSVVFGEVSDTVTQVRLDQGTIAVYIHGLRANEVYEIDTPSGIISLIDDGRYRIDVTPDGRRSTVTVRAGSATIESDNGDYSVATGTTATLIDAKQPPIMDRAIQPDSWEAWADSRDQLDVSDDASQYVSDEMVGHQDLNQYGVWQGDATYGSVWYPRNMRAGWAPYRYGRWVSIAPWGWTWIDDAPWGFAPFHYGRWAYVNSRWGWVPGGTVRSRPVYAPALVAFVGGAGWSVSASFGGGPAVGWIPLAPGERYTPGYQTSPTYLRRVNAAGGRPRPGQVAVGEVQYANRNVPGAVTAVSRDDFLRARPIGRTAVAVRPADVARARPSAVPVAGDERLVAPPRSQGSPDRGRAPRSDARPGTPPATLVTPVPPPQWRQRSRPDNGAPVDPRNRAPQPAPQLQPPPAPTPSAPPASAPPAQDRFHGRGRASVPPNAQTAAPPPQNSQPAVTPQVTPPPAAPPTDRAPLPGRGRPVPAADNAATQQRLNQLNARHQQEDADLARRQAEAQQHPPTGMTTEQLRQSQAAEKKAMADKHQRERDAVSKPKTGG